MTDATIVRRAKVEELTGLSYATLYRKMRSGEFPQRLQLGKNSVGWKLADVTQWIESRPTVADKAEADL